MTDNIRNVAQPSRKSFLARLGIRAKNRRSLANDSPSPFSDNFSRATEAQSRSHSSHEQYPPSPPSFPPPLDEDGACHEPHGKHRGHYFRARGDDEHMFGPTVRPGATKPGDPVQEHKNGSDVLFEFLNRFDPRTSSLARMLVNTHPITASTAAYRYVINQSTEKPDSDIILRDLTDGRLGHAGVRLVAAPWAYLLFGDSFAKTKSRNQVHELIYRRSTCTCIICRIHLHHSNQEAERFSESTVSASTAALQRVHPDSAQAESVKRNPLPCIDDLRKLGATLTSRELPIGEVIRLNNPNSSKLQFEPDVRELFKSLAYSGPISHEALYRQVTTVGVDYYRHNKGKKNRKVFLCGELIRLPISIGVVKNSAYPMYYPELGSTYVLYKSQTMSIYFGQIQLEGNSIGSYISTGYVFIEYCKVNIILPFTICAYSNFCLYFDLSIVLQLLGYCARRTCFFIIVYCSATGAYLLLLLHCDVKLCSVNPASRFTLDLVRSVVLLRCFQTQRG